MRFKLTLLLVVLNAALFGLIFYVDKVQSTRHLYDANSRLILPPDFVLDIERIRISSTGTDAPWIFTKTSENQWAVSSPIQWKANPYAIQQLLFQLRRLSWESRFPVSELSLAGQSLASYNLADPPLRIELSSGSATEVLKIGAPTEIGNRHYTMSPDGEFIQVISQGLLETLSRDMEAFLDRRIFGLGLEESRVMQVQDRSASNVRVRLERDATGWRFVSPIEAPADTERVQAMIAEWQSMEAEAFSMDRSAGEGINGNALRLTFEGLNARETLILAPPEEGMEAPYYLAKREEYGAVFQVEASQVRQLRRVQEELREKRILHRHAEDWTSLTVQFGELGTTLQQLESGAWQVLYTNENGELQSEPADMNILEQIRNLLRTMEAVRFVSDAPSETDMARFGLVRPQRRVILRKSSGATVELMIGDVSTDESRTLLYGTTSQTASVFMLRPHILAGIPLDPMHYRERNIHTIPESGVVAGLVLRDRSSEKILLDAEGETPEGSPADVLLDYFANMRVGRFLSEPFADPLPLDADFAIEWPYLAEVLVTYPSTPSSEPEKFRLYLSPRLGGSTQYLGDPASGLVGTLPIEVIEALDPLLQSFPEDPGIPEEPVPVESEEDLLPGEDDFLEAPQADAAVDPQPAP